MLQHNREVRSVWQQQTVRGVRLYRLLYTPDYDIGYLLGGNIQAADEWATDCEGRKKHLMSIS